MQQTRAQAKARKGAKAVNKGKAAARKKKAHDGTDSDGGDANSTGDDFSDDDFEVCVFVQGRELACKPYGWRCEQLW